MSSTSVSDLVKLFGPRAKLSRNVSSVNDESKEDWKIRFEKERENAIRAEADLSRRRSSGRFSSQIEQINQQHEAMDESNTTGVIFTAVDPVSHPASSTTSLEQADWESERDGLYQLLRNKDAEINELHQLVEKLKKQTMEQEETIGAVWELALNQSTSS
ncbi:hypothetical protein DAPPUDRAFT_303580 [Daphnia pulex]|uniref:Uncharacterized protein n=1 Tax=Daphnia pulex TaxID=6669 RepID=E9HRR5_DAPPU|nr:hypothetical protein DAPPUDRAFT_303580 [Daphnia pulex]|eukprot:EFX65576.1 hypothetical protein DAPPUDRAFT_303580 [Daphnia pulex]